METWYMFSQNVKPDSFVTIALTSKLLNSGAIQSSNISEILILFEYFQNMYPCRRRLRNKI